MSNINLGRIVPIFKGNYEGSVTYEKLDIVYFNGCSWVATGTTVGEQPSEESTSWVKVSAQGEKGETGDDGKDGKDAPVYENGFGINIVDGVINAEVSWGERSGYFTNHGDTLATTSYVQEALPSNTKSMTVTYENGTTETFNIYIE